MVENGSYVTSRVSTDPHMQPMTFTALLIFISKMNMMPKM